jgi:hypothetical protein
MKLRLGVWLLVMSMMYRRSDKTVTREIGGETLLIPITQVGVSLQKVYLLNETSAAIWRLLATPRDLEGLISALLGEYEAPEETIRRDVTAALDQLVERSLALREPEDG